MRQIGLLAALVVLLLPGGSGDRLLPLEAPLSLSAALMGLVDDGGVRLARIDPLTLTPIHRGKPAGNFDNTWVRSPDGRLVAVSTQTRNQIGNDSTLRFGNLTTLSWARKGVRLEGYLRAALWPSPSTLLALAVTSQQTLLQIVDSVAKKVVAQKQIDGTVSAVQRSADGLVLLTYPPNTIDVARLVVVGSDASVRSVKLDRILAGVSWRRDSTAEMIGDERRPGLAVDAAGGTAYVVDADGLVAAIDLDDLSLSYHNVARSFFSWLTPSAQAIGVNGPTRVAQWLGDGLIAVAGSEQTALKQQDGAFVVSGRPAGLFVIDVRSWQSRQIDARADSFVVADGLLLASGTTWASDGKSHLEAGSGIAAYGRDGAQRWHIGDGARRFVVGVFGSRAIVSRPDGGYDVIDLRTGTRVRTGIFVKLLVGWGL